MSNLLDLINQQRAKLQRPTNNRAEKLSSEKNLVRFIVPEFNGQPQMSQEWGQHFVKDQAGALKAVYICTQTIFGESCVVCDAIASGLAMTSDEDIVKALKDSRSSKRILVNALYLKGGKHENPETNPVVLDIPPSVWDSVLATAQAFGAEGVNIFDPKEGHTFIIEKTGSGMNTEYKVTPSPRATAIDPKIMTKTQDLTVWARQESEAEKSKAVTSVRVITGGPAAATTAPRLNAPTGNSAKLSAVNADAIDADFTDVSVGTTPSGDIDDFLKDL
jgi:hypothetical protein